MSESDPTHSDEVMGGLIIDGSDAYLEGIIAQVAANPEAEIDIDSLDLRPAEKAQIGGLRSFLSSLRETKTPPTTPAF